MNWLFRYRALPRSVWKLAAAELLLGLLHPAQLIVLNIHLKTLGYSDAQIGDFTSWSYLAILVTSLPLGLMIRGRRLKPALMAGAFMMPVVSWSMLAAAQSGRTDWISAAYAVWGISVVFGNVVSVPLVLRLCREDDRSEGLSLSYSTWSVALVSCGVLIEGLHSVGGLSDPVIFKVLVGLSLLSWPFVLTLQEPPPRPVETPVAQGGDHAWPRLARALLPVAALSIGAGLTIPFMSLFFRNVFGFESHEFGRLGAAAGVLIIFGALLNPSIKRRFGWGTAIVGVQVLGIGMLALLSLTDFHSTAAWAMPVACLLYVLRQPLMNMAGPISSELAMSYVGPRNRELLSALNTGVWNGSWFFSARAFSEMRSWQWPYGRIFLVTAGFYVLATLAAAWLILGWRRRRDAGLIEKEELSLE